MRIALANLRFPATPDESVALAEEAIAQAARERAAIVCFPECFVPGYRLPGKRIPPPDAQFLERGWSAVQAAARKANVAVNSRHRTRHRRRLIDLRPCSQSRWNRRRISR